jgi:hypothetical protein
VGNKVIWNFYLPPWTGTFWKVITKYKRLLMIINSVSVSLLDSNSAYILLTAHLITQLLHHLKSSAMLMEAMLGNTGGGS